MKLRYKAVTKESKVVVGIVEAKDIQEAVMYLRNKELVPINVSPESGNNLSKFLPFIGKAKSSDVILFTRQMSSMLGSGLTLIKSLEILKEQISNKIMMDIVDSIIADIEEGKNFSSAITKYPDVFTPVYISIVKSAEASGLLDKALVRLAENLEKQARLKATVKAALTYPVIVVGLMVVVIFIMMIFVIPQLNSLYVSLNVSLPFSTQIIVGLSNFIVNFWPLVIVGTVLGIFLFKRWHKTEAGKLLIDNLIFKIPVFGNLSKKIILTEFARTLSLLIGAGTLVVDALMETADTLGNVHYKNAVEDVAKKVENGITIGDAIGAYILFPPLLIQLVKVGEQTGKLDETLMKASDYFSEETDQIVKTLTTALEPFIMVTLGIGVAFLMISILAPIYSLISEIK